MLLNKIKRKITQDLKFRKIDKFLRLFLSFVIKTILYFDGVLFNRICLETNDSVVFFLYGGIGDVVMLLDQITLFYQNGNKILIICEERLVSVVKLLDFEIDIFIYDKNKFIKSLKNIKKQILKLNPVFIFNSPIFEVFICYKLLGIKKAVGFISDYSKIESFKIKHTNKFKFRLNKHANNLEIPKSLGIYNANIPPIKINLSDCEPYMIINTNKTDAWGGGKWSRKNFQLLISMYLKSTNFNIYLVGSFNEYLYVESIAEIFESERVVNLAGKTSISHMAELIKNSKLCITTDSGIMHLCSYFNAPVIALFSFSDPRVFAWGDRCVPIFNATFSCMPCVSNVTLPIDNYPVICKYNYRCDNTISVDLVYSKSLELLKGS